MLHVPGSSRSSCDGLTRRELLRAGTLGLVSTLVPQAKAVSVPSFGKARRCILLYLFGAASQIETFDPKPDAPVEVRGELGSLPTRVPGLRLGEGLPCLARLSDRLTVVRSLTHPYPIHSSAFALTSIPTIDIPTQLDARDPRHWPYIGSVVAYLDERRRRSSRAPGRRPAPANVALPWLLSSRRPHPSRNGGPYAAFLGPAYDPIWTDFAGAATTEASYEFEGKITTLRDPYGGIEPEGRFSLSAGEAATVPIPLDRLERRRSLLAQLEQAHRRLGPRAGAMDHHQQMALSLLTSTRVGQALDLRRESPRVRDSYGMTLFGQSCLVARRLLEADVPFVSVFWDEFGSVNSAWDTHYQHYPRMTRQLLPGLDAALSGLLADLEARGMLHDTAIACLTEHGRTPRIDNTRGGGRDHWSRAYSCVFAGGGFAPGKVVGRTDRIAGDVVETPVSPKDVLATMYHLLGIDPADTMNDRLDRPIAIGGEGKVRHEMLG